MAQRSPTGLILRVCAALALAAAMAAPSAAQVPGVGGAVNNTLGSAAGTVGDTLGRTRDTVNGATDRVAGDLRNVRRDLQRQLRRANPQTIDTDRDGAIVIRRDVVAVAPSAEALAAARQRGFTQGETIASGELGLTLVVLRAPQGMSTREAVEALRALDPGGAYDYNHIYLGAGEIGSSPRVTRQSSGGGGGVRVGLVDSGVDANHPALHGVSLRQRGFVGAQAIADRHGTQVASLMAGADGGFRGAAPGATIYVADVYGGAPTGGGAASIVQALGWLAAERVAVINISLVGPNNRALEAAVRALVTRGHVVVAAVGNDGASAPPLYPASYPGVIGVTGVDARNRVLPEAGRGAQVDFAAPGSDISAAQTGGGYANVRGTSFAAPIVAGLLARAIAAPNPAAAERAQAQLAATASDLGARGRDNIYGAGLVGGDVRTRAVASRR